METYKKYEILIAQDEPDIALKEHKKLEESGFKVEVVDSGSATLQRLKDDSRIDLLILDHKLPDMSC